MDRKHLMDLIKFSENSKEADEKIREYTGLETVAEKKAFLKGMFNCLDDLKATGTAEECYERYLNHIIAINIYEQKISITEKFIVKVSYKRENRHETMIFNVLIYKGSRFIGDGKFYVNSKNVVRFETSDTLCEKLQEKIKKAYPVERLQKISKQ